MSILHVVMLSPFAKEDGNLSKRAKLPAYSINMDASPIGNFAPIHEAFWDMI